MTKAGEHIPSGFSMSTISSFKTIENKNNVYRGKGSMKKFGESLTEHAMEIINFNKKKLKFLVTNEQQKSYKNVKICYICMKNLKINMLKIKNIVKLGTILIIQEKIEVAVQSICNLKYSVPKEIPIVFHNGLLFYHKRESKPVFKKFTCLGENIEKYITFAVSIQQKL